MLIVVAEQGRAMATYFTHAAEGRLQHNMPYLTEVACPSLSTVQACAQHLASVLLGKPPV